TFFFLHKHTKCSTIGHFFVTLAYQLASNFPNIKEDMNRAICNNPTVLDFSKSLHSQIIVL
ncbi:hypothetical protein BDR06DRAFT_867662, partial [Suillus hirtellus]